MQKFFTLIFLCLSSAALAQQKKPLTHSVYDNWKGLGERIISNNGKYVGYTINPQEGDGNLIIEELSNLKITQIPRGYNVVFSYDSKFAICKIKPVFEVIRQAKIKKKKADEMVKDSIAIILLGTDSIIKIANTKSFKIAEKNGQWLAYLSEKPIADSTKKKLPDSLKIKIDALVKLTDSIIKISLDSVKGNIEKQAVIAAAQKAANEIYKNAKDAVQDADDDNSTNEKNTDGTDLIVQNLETGNKKIFKPVSEYIFDKQGNTLLIKTAKATKDSNSKACILLYNLKTSIVDTIVKGFNDAKNFTFNEDGSKVVFVAERDSATKALQKIYKLWYHQSGTDTAIILAQQSSKGIPQKNTISSDADLKFSKDGNKLYFGTCLIQKPKDTTLVDFELAKLDVWTYKDDYLQPQQLKQLAQEQKRSYVAVIHLDDANKIVQLGADSLENITLVNEGNTNYVLAQSTTGGRVSSQWQGRSISKAYIIDSKTGAITFIGDNFLERVTASPMGKFIYWYNPVSRNYFTYEVQNKSIKNITNNIKVPLFDTQYDQPDYPDNIAVTGFTENDIDILINDEFDIWKVDPTATKTPINITSGFGRANKTSFTYLQTDIEKRFFNTNDTILLKSLNKQNKHAGFYSLQLNNPLKLTVLNSGAYSLSNPIKAQQVNQYLFTKSSIAAAELFTSNNLINLTRLTNIATQQYEYNWLTASLYKWKMFDGKMSEGLLFKPENFDSTKKYPIIFYFYERNSDLLYNYRAPAPSASTINIPYFVSNGYIVFDPNIYYKNGEPGQSAYNSVVSAAKALSKMPWVDSTNMAIQGQSWGGYQVAYLVTKTNIFKAASAGAPVSNMTSAYGGIRWTTGVNRQFQYEKQQSRIGATLWQRPDLYIKNSPLFAANKITTPLLIMHNDADGSVPWYQGIELFTALKRLNKKVWLLQYNGEDHNLVERRNRKDLSVRLSQFFDYYLKNAAPANWIINGVPATQKGISWGLELAE